MTLTREQRSICERVLNVFETGRPSGNYSIISIFHDGPGYVRQVTYGRLQTTEYGNLGELISRYASTNGQYSAQLATYVGKVGQVPLVDDQQFLQLLRTAGNDPVMQAVQDEFFDQIYFSKAKAWAESHGFQMALSMLVIYDSWIQSGGILMKIRNMFAEVPPSAGGDEKTWIAQYVDARNDWLAHNANPEVRPTVYRTKCLSDEVSRANWDLSQLPIRANGTLVYPAQVAIEDDRPQLVPTAQIGFAEKAVHEALAEWDYFGRNTQNQNGQTTHSGHTEQQDPYYLRIRDYWNIVGESYTGRDTDQYWSAVFISYVMSAAGAGSKFKYNAQHSRFIYRAILDRQDGNSNCAYWAFRLDERRPAIGDIVCWYRGDDLSDVDYEHQLNGDYPGHTDIIVAVDHDSVDVIGGNVSNSVTRRKLPLDNGGHLVPLQRGGEKLFAFMANRLG